MKTVNELLDDVKTRHLIQSDYKLARFLGLTDGAVSHYRHGRSLPDEMACQKIAGALDLDGDVLAAQMHSLRAKDSETRAVWERIAIRLGGLAAGVLVTVGVSGMPSPAAAASAAQNSVSCILC